MKARQLSEVREVLNSEPFRSWFDALGKARMAAREATLRPEELLTQVHLMEFRAELAQKNATDTLYRAGAYEDAAAAAQAAHWPSASMVGLPTTKPNRFAASSRAWASS